MPQIALVVSDIDGTLINSNHEVTPATRRAAGKLLDRGIALSLASSRPPRSIEPIALALGLRAPFASFNGGLLMTEAGEVVAESQLAPAVTARIKVIADELGVDVWLYDAHDWWAPNRNAFVEREEHTAGFSAVLDGYAERLARPVNKLTVVGRPELVGEAERRVLSALAAEVSASRSKPRFLDITAYGWHKGAVVPRLAGLCGVSREQVAVIGDGPNDVDMFKEAALSIAMGQAVDEVRAHADRVTASNDDEGWARGIEQFVLQGE